MLDLSLVSASLANVYSINCRLLTRQYAFLMRLINAMDSCDVFWMAFREKGQSEILARNGDLIGAGNGPRRA